MNVRGDFLKFPHSTNTTALICKSRKENPQKLTQLSSRSHPRHLVGKRTAQKDTIIDITSDSQVNSNFLLAYWSLIGFIFFRERNVRKEFVNTVLALASAMV